jgi:hypothetical protein
MQQRETATERFTDILQVIRLGRRTGTLTVERGQQFSYEEGFIVFVDGQITQASVGPLRDEEALEWLQSWGSCRFSFLPSATAITPTSPIRPLPGYLPTPDGSGPLSLASNENQAGHRRPQDTLPSTPVTPLPDTPRRVAPVEIALPQIEQIGLTRAHRRLFLLLDGQRTLTELAHLIGRTRPEVQKLLEDLAGVGFIEL